MAVPQTHEERKIYEKIISENHTGNGTIYTGKYYTLDYQPFRISDYNLKCIGIQLVTRRISDKYAHDFYTRPVHFVIKKETSFIVRLISPEYYATSQLPFKERLKLQVNKCIKEIKEREEQMYKIEDSAKKIAMCQSKIDTTMSDIIVGCKK